MPGKFKSDSTRLCRSLELIPQAPLQLDLIRLVSQHPPTTVNMDLYLLGQDQKLLLFKLRTCKYGQDMDKYMVSCFGSTRKNTQLPSDCSKQDLKIYL